MERPLGIPNGAVHVLFGITRRETVFVFARIFEPAPISARIADDLAFSTR